MQTNKDNDNASTTAGESRESALSETLAKQGFSLTASAPQIGKMNPDDKQLMVRYDVTLSYKGKEIISCPYFMGTGLILTAENKERLSAEAARRKLFFRFDAGSDERMAMLRSVVANPWATFKDQTLFGEVVLAVAVHFQVKPSLADFLNCMLSEGSAFFDAQGFEDWAGDLGYDPDSRKAEAAYKACLEHGRAMAANIGREAVEKLRVKFQDY